MFGKVFRAFLLTAVLITALTQDVEEIEYSPWCRCTVKVQYTVLLPRPAPSQRQRKFNSSRLYLYLLLLLAGDVELNPGPAASATSLESPPPPPSTDDGSKQLCAVCGLPVADMQLRSRTIANTQIKCGAKNCNSLVHHSCTDAVKQQGPVEWHWTCPKHKVNEAGVPNFFDPCQEPQGTRDAPVKKQDFKEDTPQSEPSSECLSQLISDASSTTEQNFYSTLEMTPGPSFASATLMDVMEALRLTQMKIDQLASDLVDVKKAVHAMQSLSGKQSGPGTHQSSSSLATVSHHDCDSHLQPTVSERHQAAPPSESRQKHLQDSCTQRELHSNKTTSSRHAAEQNLLVIGDSNVRRLQIGNRRPNVTFHSIPGATTGHVSQELNQLLRTSRAERVVLHTGTNDITRKGSEVVARSVFKLAQQAIEQGARRVYVCSVASRKDGGSFLFSRSESVNNRLYSLCLNDDNVSFIDLRQRLGGCPFDGLARDVVHYNRAGAVQALRMVTDITNDFLV